MKIALYAVGLLAFLICVVICVGVALPKTHVATRTRTFRTTPENIFSLISGPQDWRIDLKQYEYFEENGHRMLRETVKDGQIIRYQIVESTPPILLKRTIADKNLPFGGSWTYTVQPRAEGCALTITEEGEVYNPLFRFVSRFAIGHTRTIDNYLANLTDTVDTHLGAEGAAAR